MTRTYNKEQLIEMAGAYFEKYNVNKLFATTDGQFFLLENRARMHCGPKGNVFELTKDGSGAESEDDITINELRTRVANTEDLAELTAFMLREVAGANRNEAVNAIQVRIDEINNTPSPEAKDLARRQSVISELMGNGVDFDASADTETLETLLEEFVSGSDKYILTLDLSGNTKVVTALVEACDDKAVLEKTLEAEKAGQNRKGVANAIENRINEL